MMQLLGKLVVTSLLVMSFPVAALASVSRAGGETAVSGLRWKGTTITIAISTSLTRDNPNILPGSDVSGAIRRSFAAWERVANINFVETSSERQNASPAGAQGDGVSLITIAPSQENALLFAKEPDLVAATTRVFFNQRGQITEVDIVLNPYQQFSSDGTIGTFDLESTLTHEVGHLLGLDHTPLIGATMHGNYGRNGLYGLHNFGSRYLAAADIAAVRALYGARGDNSDCCGRVSGKVLLYNGRAAKDARVWIQETKTGSVLGESVTLADGGFRFAGLPHGSYKIFSQRAGEQAAFAAQEIAEVSVDKAETAAVTKRISIKPPDIELSYIGFNGQLSDLPVPLNPGRSYLVYLGGKNLDPKTTKIGFSSPYLTLVPNTVASRDYGEHISVLSFEVRVDPRIPDGEFSVYVESEKGTRSTLVGSLTVDELANPWSSYVLYGD